MRTSLLASLGLSLVAPLALAQAPPLLAHWQFDETAGVVASDSSANANNGQLVGFAVTSWVAGQFGNALSFDGSSDYVLIPSNPVVPVYDGLGTPFSISFWVKAPAQSDRRIYSEQQAAPSGGGPLFTLGSGSGSDTDKLRVYIRGDTGTLTPTTATSLGVVFDDSWHHVVYTDHAGRSKIYIDGVLDNAVDYSHWTFGPLSSLRTTFSLDSVTIGAVVRNAAIAAPLLGLIDDVRVYRSVLDDIDVQLLFTDVDPPVIVNSIASYGYGCGAGPLDLAISGSAASGATVYSQLFGGEPNAIAVFAVGLGGVSPTDLGPFGLPGCTLYQQPVATSFVGPLGAAGSSAPFAFAVPTVMTFAGTSLTFQGLALGARTELSPVGLAVIGR